MTQACIGLGSNLGDRAKYLSTACAALAELSGVEIIALSEVVETAPVGVAGQQPYLNQCVLIQTRQTPRWILDALHQIEQDNGRVRDEKEISIGQWQSRTLDMDLLWYGQSVCDVPRLVLPHPRLHQRWFVLAPMCDVAADWIHPILVKSIREMLANLNDADCGGPWNPECSIHE